MKYSILLVLLLICGCSNVKHVSTYIDFEDVLSPENILQENLTDEQPLRIAVYPVLSQIETIDVYRKIADRISEVLNKETVLIVRKSYAEINVLLANGGVDIAFLASGAYATYTGHEDIELIAMQQRFGVPYYYSYIIVPNDSNIEKLEDLRGHTFAFTDPLSFSGKMALIYMLEKINEKPETFFSNYFYTYGHQNSLESVANKIVDGAAIGSLVYDNAKENGIELISKIRIIETSEKNGTGPVVVRKNLGEEDILKLKNLFLYLHEDEEMKLVLEKLLIDKYIEPQMELYDYSKSMLNRTDE